ncbi:MAG: hypothetical protein CO071_00610 [Gallionellales bacterium CG_4_9_14_0_8_um_filter_59_50]|nr:MAG: hypothetical protein CO071_00610 [Gallionellales bacterium CG_4_9_14_0_8_um_filter_59_50]
MLQGHKAGHRCLTPRENAAIIPPPDVVPAQEKEKNRQLITLQLVAVSAIAAGYLGYGAAPQESIAVWCGGGVSIFNSLLIAWRMKRANSQALRNAQLQLRLLFFFAAERFLLVMLMLGLLMTVSHRPLAVLSGFVAGQAVMILARLYLQLRIK